MQTMKRDHPTAKDGISGEPRGSNLTRRIFLPALTAAVTSSGLAAAKPAAQGKQPPATSSDLGTVWWTELRTRNLAATRDFYAGVIGWTPKLVAQDDMNSPPAAGEKGYTLFMMHGEEVAGAEEIDAGERPGWLTYIEVDNVDEAVARAAKRGGKIVQQPSDIAGVGRVAEIEDPEGNRLGLVAPRT
jgi:uncharacterized protein